MAEFFTGTLLASPIVRGSSGDTYGTHHSILGVGGYMEVNTISERNALPIDSVNGIGYDGISSGQRRIGMLVNVHADNTIYKLNISESTWSTLTELDKLLALANNANWEVFVAGSTGANGENISKDFEQTTHGFVVGDVIGYNGTEYTKVSDSTAITIEPLGLVTEVVDLNNFKITYSGFISTTGFKDVNLSGLTGGSVYYLSNVAGKITATAPSTVNVISKQVLVALSGDTGIVLQYRGINNSDDGVNYEMFTGYTTSTQLYLDKTVTGATNLGYFTGYTGIQTLPINHLTIDAYDGEYTSLYNNYYRDVDGYIRIGVASDGVPRRGYLRSTLPKKSWVWNEHTGDGAAIGWIFVNGDVSSDSVYGELYNYGDVGYSIPEYTGDTWTEGSFYNNGSQVVVNAVLGNLTSGSTYDIGGPIYRDKVDKELRLRTIVSNTPDSLKVEYDDYYIKLSATTSIDLDIENIGTGVDVYSGTSGSTVLFKTLVGGGDTSVVDDGDHITISSTGGGTTSSGENVTKRLTITNHGFAINDVIGWSGGSYNKIIADGNYDGETIGVVSDVVNANTFDVTQSGYISGFTGLVTNSTYFISGTIAGAISQTAPTTVGYLVKPILIAISPTSAWVLSYQGYTIEPPITGGTGTTGGGNDIYTGKTPSTITVGGISDGTTLTGRSYTSLFQELLVPTLSPTYVAPSNQFTSPQSGTYEVGCVVNMSFNSSFNKGAINLDGSFQDYRSGDVNCYFYSGNGLPASVASSNLSDAQSVNNVTVNNGSESWSSCVGYNAGPQPYDSNGDDSGSPLLPSISGPKTVSISGIYPYYYGKLASGSRPAVTNALVNSGNKVVGNSNATVSVNFNSSTSEYSWVAIPSTSTSKTCWYVNGLDNGRVNNAPSDKYPDECVISITSSDGCWSNINYKVYMSGTVGAISELMQFRNS